MIPTFSSPVRALGGTRPPSHVLVAGGSSSPVPFLAFRWHTYSPRDKEAAAKLSHVLRRANENGDKAMLTSELAEAILATVPQTSRAGRPPDFGGSQNTFPALARRSGSNREFTGRSSAAARHEGIPPLALDHLFAAGLLTGTNSNAIGASGAHATPSFAGWDHYESLRRGAGKYRKAFMAMKFGDPALDAMLESVFKPSVQQAGFDLVRLDDVPRAGLIDDRLRVEIQASDFVVADLTHENLGAYWEAGYAEGLGKPVIYTCEHAKFEATKTHFDTNHHLTITWDSSAPATAGERLKATVRATLPHLARQHDAAR